MKFNRSTKLSKTLQVALISTGTLLVGVGVVAAQGEATEAPSGGASEGTAESPQLTAEQMATKARSVMAVIDASAQNISRMLSEARAAKDVVKALCLDDKLSQFDVAKRSAADRVESLESAAKAGNADRVEHDFAVIGALEERTNALSAEANQCIGEEKGYVGGSSLKVVVDPTIPQSDTTLVRSGLGSSIPLVGDPPQAASPTF